MYHNVQQYKNKEYIRTTQLLCRYYVMSLSLWEVTVWAWKQLPALIVTIRYDTIKSISGYWASFVVIWALNCIMIIVFVNRLYITPDK